MPRSNPTGTPDTPVLAGGSSLLEPGTSENTCANWTSTADAIPMVYGRSLASDPFGYFHVYETTTACSQGVYGVLCLQE